MLGSYVVVDKQGVHLTRNISEKYKQQVMGGMSQEDYIKMKQLDPTLIASMVGSDKVMVFKYLGQKTKKHDVYFEKNFKELPKEDVNVMKALTDLVMDFMDNNYIVEWS